MTPVQIIEIVDRITPNAHTDADKLRWLGALDAQIVRETAMLFDDDPVNLSLLFQDYVPDAEQRLCVSGPDAEELYGSYLQACMAWADEDDARYDRFITRFNDAYERYMRYMIQNAKRLARAWLKF